MNLGHGLWLTFPVGQVIRGGGPVPQAPINTAAPAITGTVQVGQTINTSTGTWTGDSPITYEYKWQSSADGSTGWTDIAGATTASLAVVSGHLSRYLRSQVRATNAVGASGWISSAAAGPVTKALAAPVRVSAPGVVGTFWVGQTLTVNPAAAYSGNPTPTVSYRWQARPNGGGTITNVGTGPTLVLTEAMLGMQIRVQDMASNSQGSTTWQGATWLGPVQAAADTPFLNDPASVARGLTISAVGPNYLSFTSNSSDTRRGYSMPIPPAGSVIEFDVTTDNTLYLRLDTSTNLDPTDHVEVVSPLAAGTHHVSATIPSYGAEYLWLGFLTQVIGQNVQITNWRVTHPASALKAGTLTNPAFAIMPNWDGIYNSNNNPFLDWLKLGSEWETSGTTTTMDWSALQAAGHITADGTINSIPAGADNIGMRVLSGIPAESTTASGRYRLYFTGDGGIGLNGAGSVDWPATGQAEFNYTATGGSFVTILVDRVDSPIKFQALVHEDDWADYEAGEIFRAAWLDLIRNNRVVRFTDWMEVDYYEGSGLWADRYPENRITYQGGEGVPVEAMCKLCNKIGADPWFSLLSNADDNYVTQFATVALATLDAERQPYFELSNKIWDGANWATASHFRDLAQTLFGDTGIEACMEAYGGRSSQVFGLIRAVWSGANAARVHTVLQAWTPNAYISAFAMTAPRWVALGGGRVAPYTVATEWALHANLDGGMRYEDDEHPNIITTIQGWFDTLTDAQIFDNMADAMRNGNSAIGPGYTMAGLASAYTDQKNLIAYYGNVLNPICYEGGSHLAVPPSRNGNSQWISKYLAFYQSPQWTDVWSDSITETWYGAFGPSSFYTRKNDIRLPDANNGYGLLRWPGDVAGNLQLAEWNTLQAARTGATGRGTDDFVGDYDYAPSGA